MQHTLQVTFHGMPHSDALDASIREHAGRLEKFHPHIISFRAAVEELARHKHQGKEFSVRLDIKVPGGEVAVSHDHSEDPFVAVRDAFDAARRRLEDHVRRQRGAARRGEARAKRGKS